MQERARTLLIELFVMHMTYLISGSRKMDTFDLIFLIATREGI